MVVEQLDVCTTAKLSASGDCHKCEAPRQAPVNHQHHILTAEYRLLHTSRLQHSIHAQVVRGRQLVEQLDGVQLRLWETAGAKIQLLAGAAEQQHKCWTAGRDEGFAHDTFSDKG